MNDPYTDDPYSAFIGDIIHAINRAEANDEAMSEGEVDTIKAIKGVLRRCDPDVIPMLNNPERQRGERGRGKAK